MSIIVPAEVKGISAPAGNIWKCHVCGFISRGMNPPEECPQCASTKKEFEEISEKKKLQYTGEPFDVLLISYRIHGAQYNTITDTEFLKNDPLVILKVNGMAANVVEMPKLDLETKLKGKLVPVCE
jgi:rubredoxin